IAPTLAALILPVGSSYESLLPPLTQSRSAFNHKLYIENGHIGDEQALPDSGLKQTMEAARTVAVWRITKGNALP
ncbi:MAG: LTA synthase family protein, partial [Megasphaera elsdenii]|nr:LTA synthase family protein [Megasphaera elsdenii]